MKAEERIAQAATSIVEQMQALRADVAAGVAEFHNGVRLQGARYVSVGGSDGRRLAWAAAGRLLGWSLRNTGGAAATVVLRDSRNAGMGEILGEITLAAGEAETIWLGPGGVSFVEALYVDANAPATVEGAVYIGTVAA